MEIMSLGCDERGAVVNEKQMWKLLGLPLFADRNRHETPDIDWRNGKKQITYLASSKSGHLMVWVDAIYGPIDTVAAGIVYRFEQAHYMVTISQELPLSDQQYWHNEVVKAFQMVGVTHLQVPI